MDAMRLQVTEHGRLVAEVIGSYDYIESLRSRYAMAKYRAGKACGGMLTQRADLPRGFDVGVGETLPCAECKADVENDGHAPKCSQFDANECDPGYDPRDQWDTWEDWRGER